MKTSLDSVKRLLKLWDLRTTRNLIVIAVTYVVSCSFQMTETIHSMAAEWGSKTVWLRIPQTYRVAAITVLVMTEKHLQRT